MSSHTIQVPVKARSLFRAKMKKEIKLFLGSLPGCLCTWAGSQGLRGISAGSHWLYVASLLFLLTWCLGPEEGFSLEGLSCQMSCT